MQPKKVLLIFTGPRVTLFFQNLIATEFFHSPDIILTDSFNHAWETIPIDCDLLVITTASFSDRTSSHRHEYPDVKGRAKDVLNLSMHIHKVNPHSKVIIYSLDQNPEPSKYISEYIRRDGLDNNTMLIKKRISDHLHGNES